VAWGDYDNDGDLDLYLTNYEQTNKLLRNDGGNVFSALTNGPLGNTGAGTGVAWADYDRDGDLDLYFANDGQPSKLLRNDVGSTKRWLHLDLVGQVSNTLAIGARVEVWTGSTRRLEEVSGGSGYCSQNSPTLEFGLAAFTLADSIVVTWPSGIVERYVSVQANQRLTLTEMEGLTSSPLPQHVVPLALAPPVPSPAREKTLLRFALPHAAQAQLAIYDLQGRRVATLVDGNRDAGWNAISWSGRDARGRRVAPGIYFARLEVQREVHTRKIVWLR
jgi:hypothetical protein